MDTEKQKLNLLCDAAQLLLENGSETYRVEETAQRMAKGLNIEYVNIAALPTTVFLEADGRACVRRISRRGTNSQRIAMVNEISRRIERGEMTPDMAKAELERARRMPGFSQRTMLIAYALAAASFCLLFGGGAGTFAVTFVIGLLVQAVLPLFAQIPMGARRADDRHTRAGYSCVYSLRKRKRRDYRRHYAPAFRLGDDDRRARYGVWRPDFRHDARTGGVAAGCRRCVGCLCRAEVCGDDGRGNRAVSLLKTLLVAALGAFGGTLGYAFILNAPKKTILPASFIGLFGYMAYVLLGMAGMGTMSAYFLSTVLVSVVCEIEARVMRMPSTIFLLSALVPLVPGYNFYLAMLALVEDRGTAAAREGLVAVQIVAAIAIGAAVTSVCFRAFVTSRQKGKQEKLSRAPKEG